MGGEKERHSEGLKESHSHLTLATSSNKFLAKKSIVRKKECASEHVLLMSTSCSMILPQY